MKEKLVKRILRKIPEASRKVFGSLRRAIDEGGFTIDSQQRMDIETERRNLRDRLLREENREE